MNRRYSLAIALVLFLLVAGPARAEERKHAFEISEFLAWTDFSEAAGLAENWGGGIRFGHNITPAWTIELSYHLSPDIEIDLQRVPNGPKIPLGGSGSKDVKIILPTVDMQEIQFVAIYNWDRMGKKFGTRFQPYIFGGLGVSDYDPGAGLNINDATRRIVSPIGFTKKVLKPRGDSFKIEQNGTYVMGGGSKFYLNEAFALRMDLRWVSAIAGDFTNFQPNFGASFIVGGKKPARDSDGDGVVDYKDDCADTPEGATVDRRGCPSDSDGDGVFDGIDECADTPEGVVVDSKGCPVDSDGDGVYDGPDQCADTPENAKVDAKGCPVDSDGDGVFDGIDTCADTPQGAKVDAKGCPIDSDGDGVFDGIDQCAKTRKGVKVDARGCDLDGDGDGVPDGLDQCPDTPAGTKVRTDGCPEVEPLFEEDQKTLVLRGVTFDVNEATLTAESETVLDEVAASLIAYPDVRVEVQGHTDSTGSAAYNLALSQRRAQSVVNYLTEKGVSNAQLEVKGYGEAAPIASNNTKAGRAENRRVELLRLDE